MMHSPLEQFKIQELFHLELFGINVSFNNSALLMLITLITCVLFLSLSIRKKALIPGRLQTSAEMLYELVDGIIEGTTGSEGKKYMPIIFTTFIFVLFCNLLGMIPYSFTITSHIIVTFAIAASIFIAITILGFIRHGFHYFSLFLPEGTPSLLAPLMILIELFSYLSRPVSLAVRLAANMTAGHIVMKLLASFTIMGGLTLGIFPFAFLTIMQGFEIFVAVLQAYIFTILSCVYLNDAINLH
ncbi:F0F1 ATP synthase subunit A [endosymbiont of Acanthamoeba sp. UWC8]|uniref:F0F1 ATP synthase subunit A n=1 Tax=endosymbiont of Acanthamoeba sp. UWC8 TaxID=86106 RepID=UPI000571C79C